MPANGSYDPNTANDPLEAGSRTSEPKALFWFWVASGLTVACTPAGILVASGLGAVWASIVAVLVGLAFAGGVLAIVTPGGLRTGVATLALSRGVFGRRGNVLHLVVSFLVLMGWCAISSVMVVHGVEAILREFGVAPSDILRLVILGLFAIALVLLVSLGYRFIQMTQLWISLAVGLCCILVGAYAVANTDWSSLPAATLSPSAWLAAIVISLTNGASGWWNAGSDFSRFLRPGTSPRATMLATLAGMSGVVLIVLLGVAIYFYRPSILHADNPIYEGTRSLPMPIMVMGLVVVIVGLHASAVTNMYSATLNLNTLGVRAKALAIAGCALLVVGIALWVLFGRSGFYGWFSSFLTVLGVPLAAWAGVFVVPILSGGGWPKPRGAVVLGALGWMLLAMVLGFDFLQSDTEGMRWVGYLVRNSAFSAAGGGVLVAVVVAFVGSWLTRRYWLYPSTHAGVPA